MKAFEMFSVVFIAFLIFQESFATVPVNGTCDTKCALNGTTVNLTDYLGIWFLQQYVPNGPNDATKCTYLNISAIEENTIVASTHFITHP